MSAERPKTRISKLLVDRGKTKSSSGEEWNRVLYGIEFEFSSEATMKDFEDARQAAESKIVEWIKEGIAEKPVAPSALDPAQLDKLPWKHYQTKELVGPGHTGWILWERDGGADLAKIIRESQEQKLKIGPYEFVFSGKEKQFISRKVVEPVEPKEEAPSQ